LRGEPAVRILDMAGIVANKNTIPGDTVTALAMGIRLGTPWLSQRGFGPAEIDQVAGLIHKVVTNIHPFSYTGLTGELPRGKIDLEILEEVKAEVAALAARGAAATEDRGTGYPHFFAATKPTDRVILVSGERAVPSLAQILTSDVAALQPGQHQDAFMLDADSRVMAEVAVLRLPRDECGRDRFALVLTPPASDRVLAWLRGLGDGYTLFDRADLFAKVEGPLVVEEVEAEELGAAVQALAARMHEPGLPAGTPGLDAHQAHADHFELCKPYFVGHEAFAEVRRSLKVPQLPEFRWAEPADAALKRTPLYDWHKAHNQSAYLFMRNIILRGVKR
jgi:glycine hydroxymethyltransferase